MGRIIINLSVFCKTGDGPKFTVNFYKPRRNTKERKENNIKNLNKKFLEVRYQRNLFIKRPLAALFWRQK